MSPVNDNFLSASLDNTVRLWDLRTSVCEVGSCCLTCLLSYNQKGLVRVQGHPTVSYDNEGLIFAVAYAGSVRLFDARQYDHVFSNVMHTFLLARDLSLHLWSYQRWSTHHLSLVQMAS